MDRLDYYCLIHIFQHLDLSSRFQASKTCKLWRALLQDSEVLLNDVDEVYLDEWTPDKDKSELQSVLAVLSHLKKCRQLKLGPGVAPDFLSEQRLNDELTRFDNVVINPKQGRWGNSLVPCLSLLPATVTRLKIDNCDSRGFSVSLPDSVRLESLNLTFWGVEVGAGPFALPSTLSAYGYSYFSPFIAPERDFGSYLVRSGHATVYFLQSFPIGPALTDLKLRGLYFSDKTISFFLRILRDSSPNLHRMSFREVAFEFKDIDAIMKEFSVAKGKDDRLLPIQRIEFEKCLMHWNAAVHLLIRISDVKTMIINLRQRSPPEELAALYEGAIKEKGAKLELTINSINGARDLAEILVPSELSGVLSKLELVKIRHTQLLQVMLCGNDSFELLTQIRLEGCVDLGDAALDSVAKWCTNLKNLKFQPPHDCFGFNPVTDQCLQPFMVHWDARKSTQLSIECLKPARPFNGFGLPNGQEKGLFHDGKKWMVFRKARLLDGCDEMGTRLLIWDDQIDGGEKSMVITDYKRKFEKNFQISVVDGKCIVKHSF